MIGQYIDFLRVIRQYIDCPRVIGQYIDCLWVKGPIHRLSTRDWSNL